MGILTQRADISSSNETLNTAEKFSDILPLLKSVGKSLLGSIQPGIIFSIGHLRGSDPGAVNTVTSGDDYFEDEVSANEMSIIQVLKAYVSKNLSIVIQSPTSLGSIIKGALVIFGLSERSILVSLHHDSAYPVTNASYEKGKITLYYSSNRGLNVCEEIKKRFAAINSDIKIVILHHTKSPRRRLGFVASTLHIAVLIDMSFISRPKNALIADSSVLAEVLAGIEADINNDSLNFD